MKGSIYTSQRCACGGGSSSTMRGGIITIADAEDWPRADVFFFRHRSGAQGANAGVQFGVSYFNKWWKRACQELGVTVYADTKHSTVTNLSEVLSTEEIRRGGSEHSTNSAFERHPIPSQREIEVPTGSKKAEIR